MSQLGRPQRSAQIRPCHNIENQIYCKDPVGRRYREGQRSDTDFWRRWAAQHGESQVQASGVSAKDTHLWRVAPWARAGGRGGMGGALFYGSADDWQKMSGARRQPHTDTQQADVTDCMIRRKWRLHRVMSSFRSSQTRPPQHLNSSVWLNKYLLTYHPNVPDLKVVSL